MTARAKPRPTHYRVVCISLYTEDLARIDAAVSELKRRGHTKATRSSVLRAAMLQVDLAEVPPVTPLRSYYCARHRAWYVARGEGRAWRWVRVDGPPAEVPSC